MISITSFLLSIRSKWVVPTVDGSLRWCKDMQITDNFNKKREENDISMLFLRFYLDVIDCTGFVYSCVRNIYGWQNKNRDYKNNNLPKMSSSVKTQTIIGGCDFYGCIIQNSCYGLSTRPLFYKNDSFFLPKKIVKPC